MFRVLAPSSFFSFYLTVGTKCFVIINYSVLKCKAVDIRFAHQRLDREMERWRERYSHRGGERYICTLQSKLMVHVIAPVIISRIIYTDRLSCIISHGTRNERCAIVNARL